MDSVELPLFLPDESISNALSELRAKNRSGLVVGEGNGYLLLYAGDLLRARASGATTLRDVANGEPVVILENHHIQQFQLDLTTPKNTWKEYEKFLQSVGSRYTLTGTTRDTAMVVTASETDVMALTLTGGYQCDGTPTHSFPRPRVGDGQDCPMWPECSRSDGQRPKVHPAP